jgi:hypothetical protein
MPPLNHRPIRLLNSSGELVEKIILKRLNFGLSKLKAIRNDQYCFKIGHSTINATCRALRTVSTKRKLQ